MRKTNSKEVKQAVRKYLLESINFVLEEREMYIMEVYRTEDKKLFRTEKSNNLEYFDRYKNRSNYKIKIFQKVKNRWELIYSE